MKFRVVKVLCKYSAFLTTSLRLSLFRAFVSQFQGESLPSSSSSSDDNATPRALCTVEGGQVFVSDDINLCVRRRGSNREIQHSHRISLSCARARFSPVRLPSLSPSRYSAPRLPVCHPLSASSSSAGQISGPGSVRFLLLFRSPLSRASYILDLFIAYGATSILFPRKTPGISANKLARDVTPDGISSDYSLRSCRWYVALTFPRESSR